MKKILCLALVLILTMSVAFSASAEGIEDIAGALGNMDLSFEVPKFASISEAFDAVAEFLKLESIMVYVDEFHLYMDDFYRELHVALQAFGLVINGILSGVFAN